jgi:bilirubin oxidase
MLAVAERAEILVDMSDLENVALMSYEIEGAEPLLQKFVERLLGAQRDEQQVFKILELRPQRSDRVEVALPEKLNTIQRWTEAEAITTRNFTLGNNDINGKKMDINRIDEVVQLGAKEIWTLTNPTGSHHPFHVHDVQFLILDRNGEAPPAYEQGWKDTVFVDSDDTVRVMMEFKDYADPHAAYMFHCHILEHEDHGMMGQFVVVEPGTAAEDIYINSELTAHQEAHHH